MRWPTFRLRLTYNAMGVTMTVMQLLFNVFRRALRDWIERDPEANQDRLAALFTDQIETVVAGAEKAGTVAPAPAPAPAELPA